MLRVARVCVDPSTPAGSPKKVRVELPQGILSEVKILIPPGHQALAGVRIKYGLEVIVPWHQDDWIRGDFIVITDTPGYPLPNEPSEVTVEAYNEDDTYPHCFYLYFVVKREEELTIGLLKRFLKALRILR